MAVHLTMKVALTTVRHGCFLFQWDLFFFFLVSELLPLNLNLAIVRFNVNEHLDPHTVFG